MDYQLFKELGLIAVTAIPMFFLIKWIAEEFKVTLSAHRVERKEFQESQKVWSDLYAGHLKEMAEHNERAISFQSVVQEQHARMCERLENTALEHREMITTLARINGYKNDHS